jgi:hypothetical protein
MKKSAERYNPSNNPDSRQNRHGFRPAGHLILAVACVLGLAVAALIIWAPWNEDADANPAQGGYAPVQQFSPAPAVILAPDA